MKCDLKVEKRKGEKVEMEHAHWFPKSERRMWAGRIASDHLREFPCYYSEGLIPMEKQFQKDKRRSTKR
jgi:hypothetical protein